MLKYFLQLSSPSSVVNFNEGNLSFDGSSKILEKFPTLHVEIPRFRVSSAAQPIISEKTIKQSFFASDWLKFETLP